MTEETKKPLTLGLKPKTLELKKPPEAGGGMKQNVAFGRSKVITVEVRKKRIPTGSDSPAKDENDQPIDEGQAHRLKILMQAKAEEEVRARAAEKARKEREEAEAAEEAVRARTAKEVSKAAPAAAETPKDAPAAAPSPADMPLPPADKAREVKKKPFVSGAAGEEETDSGKVFRKIGGGRDFPEADQKRQRPKSGDERRGGARLSVRSVSGDEEEERAPRGRSLSSIKRAREKERLKMMELRQPPEKVFREVVIPEFITVQDLATRMSERASAVIKILMRLGVMATITQTIDADTAQLVVEEMGHKFRRVAEGDVEDTLKDAATQDRPEDMKPRPPVVTVMGHVDHGKTSLLDALRSTSVAEKEAGGITQHIGAYQVRMENGQKVTFIDTPGHAAFTSMRARGAQVTDVVILVVAANDGVMPQTVEAIKHAQAAQVPIVVAINKIDVPGANPAQVRSELLQHGIIAEEFGGDVQMVEVSAKKRINLDKLIEATLLQAEVLELKANANRPAAGVVIEAKMEKGRGPVATVLIQKGTLKVGDVFVAGKEHGRVRALVNERGQKMTQALPAEPVEVLGMEATPQAGDEFVVLESESKAKEISDYRHRKEREAQQVKSVRAASENIFDRIAIGDNKELAVIIKADVQGSVEALVGTLSKIATDKARVRVLHAAVGAINESDVTLANASHALLVGFNVRAAQKARDMAKRDSIEIRYYSIIYDVANDMKQLLEGMLAPEIREKIIGYAEIRQVFNITKFGKVAGCYVTEGLVKRGEKVRILRDNVVVYTGALTQLKRYKDDVKEARETMECGMSFENYDDIRVGDMVECFETEEIATKLNLGEI